MDTRKCYREDGYQKGFEDGRRTGGKAKKSYIENFLKNETQDLSDMESMEFKKGWHDGFYDGVTVVLNNMVKKEDIFLKQIYEFK